MREAALAGGVRPAMEGGLRLNFLPVRLDADSIDCTEVSYRSAEDLRELRERTTDTHVVIRAGSRVRLVELRPEVPHIGDPVTLPVPGAGSRLAATLLREALRREVTTTWGYQLRRQSPPTFVSRRLGRDLLEPVRERLPAIAAFHVYPQYSLDGRQLHATGDVGVLIGLKARYEIDLTAGELQDLGLDLVGRHVLAAEGVEPFPFQDPRCARRLLGVVRRVDGDHLVVDTGGGVVQRHPAGRLWLEAGRDNFDQALTLVTGTKAGRVLSGLEARLYELTGGPGRLADVRRIARDLGSRGPLRLAVGVQVLIGEVLGDEGSRRSIRVLRLTEPTYAFDQAGDKSARYPEPGLKEFGPMDREHFSPKTPHLVVVTPAGAQGKVEEFMRAFRDGVPNSSFADGFLRRFGLTGLQVSLVPFDDSGADTAHAGGPGNGRDGSFDGGRGGSRDSGSADDVTDGAPFDGPRAGPGAGPDAKAYRKACLRALDEHPKPDLAIVIVTRRQRHLTGNASPYLVAKSVFMSMSVPVQEFQIENLRDRDFTEILRNVSLACYAKMGGIPYLIRAPYRPMAHELVIGLGSAYRTPDRMSAGERSVGITTVFDTFGNYLVSNSSREAAYDDYPEALQEALAECIEDVKRRKLWQPTDTIRLVFHVFKPLRDREAVAVKRLVEDMAREFASVEFAFVHVSGDHDWMVFDPANKGLDRRGRIKGAGLSRRGQAVRLGRSEMLVTVLGPGDLKTATQGAPQPLLLTLHRESTFQDLEYLAEQLFRFTGMSWRRPFPASKPVTILYSELIAGLLGQLREVRNWNSDQVGGRLQLSRWFL
jgi:hypothetical protein